MAGVVLTSKDNHRGVQGRTHVNTAEILNDKNEVLARSRGIFIAIDPEKMFAKYVERRTTGRKPSVSCSDSRISGLGNAESRRWKLQSVYRRREVH
jgi:hypothetical protein